MISERWQAEVAETVFDTVNQEADKVEAKKKSKHRKFDLDEKGNSLFACLRGNAAQETRSVPMRTRFDSPPSPAK